MILSAVIGLFIVSVVFMMIRKKVNALPLIVGILCAVLILVHIGGVIISDNEHLDTAVLDKVASIPWDNEDYLSSRGFEKRDDLMVYDGFIGWDKRESPIFFCIYVENADKSRIEQEHSLKEESGVLCSYSKQNLYNTIISEFLSRADAASRFYQFYVNDRLVTVREDNPQDTQKLFEEYILNLK